MVEASGRRVRADRELVPYRLRTVRVGVISTAMAVALLSLYPLVARSTPEGGWTGYYLLLGIAAVGGAAVAVLPWERLFHRGWGVPALYLWSVADIVIISVEVALTGGVRSELWVIYLLTTIFFAASYPVAGQVVLLGFTAVAYVVAAMAAGDPLPGVLIVRLGGLGLLAFMASFLSRELMRQMGEHVRQRAAAERHADILDRVAAASRQLHSHDTTAVLEAVVDTVAGLGLTWAGIARLDASSRSFEVVHSKGLPPEVTGGGNAFSITGPLARMVESGGLVMSDVDGSDVPAPAWEPARGIVVAPIHVRGDIAAVLGGALLEGEGPIRAEVAEAVELLASLAGRALELAAAFEEERGTVERLEQLDLLKRDFLSNVSHELRTPLTVMLGVNELLQTHWEELDEERRRDLFRRQAEHVTALRRTIERLLDFSQLEAGRLDPEVRSLDLVPLVTDLVDRLEGSLDRHRLTLDLTERADVVADPQLLERVVENLLLNAATHTPPGTRVSLTVVAEGPQVRVSVNDEGPGIPASDLGHVTDRFFRGGDPDTRPTRGLGLGLAMSREILLAHGSELEVESEVGQGTRFSFALPAAALSPAKPTAAPPTDPASPP